MLLVGLLFETRQRYILHRQASAAKGVMGALPPGLKR